MQYSTNRERAVIKIREEIFGHFLSAFGPSPPIFEAVNVFSCVLLFFIFVVVNVNVGNAPTPLDLNVLCKVNPLCKLSQIECFNLSF